MRSSVLIFITLGFCSLTRISAYRVLLVPALSGGHLAPFAGLAEELDKQGHQVFTLAVFHRDIKIPPSLNTPPNRSIVEFNVRDESIWENSPDKFAEAVLGGGTDIRTVMKRLPNFVEKLTNNLLMLNEDTFEKLVDMQLDVAIVDDMFATRYLHLVPHRLGIPVISLIHFVESTYLRIPHPPSFVPSPLLPYSDQMTFSERLTTLAMLAGFELFPIMPELSKSIREKYCKYGHFDSLDEVGRKSLLWIQVTDPVLDFPTPTMPHVVQVGGLSATLTKKPLAPKFQDFVDGSTRGIIVMTFGSSLSKLPREMASKFLSAFQQINERIVWRFDNNDDLEIPENVLISSWIPQNDLLAHPATCLFITHSGSGGQMETIAHGVPMLSFPLFGDQGYNSARAERRGFSVTMNIHSFTSDQLVTSIRKMIDDPSYRERTREAAEIIKERLNTPGQLAVHWINHVLKHRNYLRSPALDMNLFKYLMLDMFLALAIGFVASTVMIYFCVRFVYRKCRKTKQDIYIYTHTYLS